MEENVNVSTLLTSLKNLLETNDKIRTDFLKDGLTKILFKNRISFEELTEIRRDLDDIFQTAESYVSSLIREDNENVEEEEIILEAPEEFRTDEIFEPKPSETYREETNDIPEAALSVRQEEVPCENQVQTFSNDKRAKDDNLLQRVSNYFILNQINNENDCQIHNYGINNNKIEDNQIDDNKINDYEIKNNEINDNKIKNNDINDKEIEDKIDDNVASYLIELVDKIVTCTFDKIVGEVVKPDLNDSRPSISRYVLNGVVVGATNAKQVTGVELGEIKKCDFNLKGINKDMSSFKEDVFELNEDMNGKSRKGGFKSEENRENEGNCKNYGSFDVINSFDEGKSKVLLPPPISVEVNEEVNLSFRDFFDGSKSSVKSDSSTSVKFDVCDKNVGFLPELPDKSVLDLISLKLNDLKYKEDENLQKEGEKLPKKDEKLSKEDEKLSKKGEKLSKKDEKLSKEDEKLSKKDEKLSKEDEKRVNKRKESVLKGIKSDLGAILEEENQKSNFLNKKSNFLDQKSNFLDEKSNFLNQKSNFLDEKSNFLNQKSINHNQKNESNLEYKTNTQNNYVDKINFDLITLKTDNLKHLKNASNPNNENKIFSLKTSENVLKTTLESSLELKSNLEDPNLANNSSSFHKVMKFNEERCLEGNLEQSRLEIQQNQSFHEVRGNENDLNQNEINFSEEMLNRRQKNVDNTKNLFDMEGNLIYLSNEFVVNLKTNVNEENDLKINKLKVINDKNPINEVEILDEIEQSLKNLDLSNEIDVREKIDQINQKKLEEIENSSLIKVIDEENGIIDKIKQEKLVKNEVLKSIEEENNENYDYSLKIFDELEENNSEWKINQINPEKSQEIEKLISIQEENVLKTDQTLKIVDLLEQIDVKHKIDQMNREKSQKTEHFEIINKENDLIDEINEEDFQEIKILKIIKEEGYQKEKIDQINQQKLQEMENFQIIKEESDLVDIKSEQSSKIFDLSKEIDENRQKIENIQDFDKNRHKIGENRYKIDENRQKIDQIDQNFDQIDQKKLEEIENFEIFTKEKDQKQKIYQINQQKLQEIENFEVIKKDNDLVDIKIKQSSTFFDLSKKIDENSQKIDQIDKKVDQIDQNKLGGTENFGIFTKEKHQKQKIDEINQQKIQEIENFEVIKKGNDLVDIKIKQSSKIFDLSKKIDENRGKIENIQDFDKNRQKIDETRQKIDQIYKKIDQIDQKKLGGNENFEIITKGKDQNQKINQANQQKLQEIENFEIIKNENDLVDIKIQQSSKIFDFSKKIEDTGQKMDEIDQKMNEIDQKMDEIDQKMDEIDQKIDEIDQKKLQETENLPKPIKSNLEQSPRILDLPVIGNYNYPKSIISQTTLEQSQNKLDQLLKSPKTNYKKIRRKPESTPLINNKIKINLDKSNYLTPNVNLENEERIKDELRGNHNKKDGELLNNQMIDKKINEMIHKMNDNVICETIDEKNCKMIHKKIGERNDKVIYDMNDEMIYKMNDEMIYKMNDEMIHEKIGGTNDGQNDEENYKMIRKKISERNDKVIYEVNDEMIPKKIGETNDEVIYETDDKKIHKMIHEKISERNDKVIDETIDKNIHEMIHEKIGGMICKTIDEKNQKIDKNIHKMIDEKIGGMICKTIDEKNQKIDKNIHKMIDKKIGGMIFETIDEKNQKIIHEKISEMNDKVIYETIDEMIHEMNDKVVYEKNHETTDEMIHEKIDETIDEMIYETIDKKIDEKIDGKIDEKIHGKTDEMIYETIDIKIYEKIDGKIDEKIHGKIDEMINEAIDEMIEENLDETITKLNLEMQRSAEIDESLQRTDEEDVEDDEAEEEEGDARDARQSIDASVGVSCAHAVRCSRLPAVEDRVTRLTPRFDDHHHEITISPSYNNHPQLKNSLKNDFPNLIQSDNSTSSKNDSISFKTDLIFEDDEPRLLTSKNVNPKNNNEKGRLKVLEEKLKEAGITDGKEIQDCYFKIGNSFTSSDEEEDFFPSDSEDFKFSEFHSNDFHQPILCYELENYQIDEDDVENPFINFTNHQKIINSTMRGDSDKKHNPDKENLKSLLKKPGKNKDNQSKKNRVVFNETKNEFFDADYIILIREECEYDEEEDDGVCTCNQHEMVRLTCCEPNCNCNVSYDGYDATPPSPKFAPPLEFVDAVTLSPPEEYKDMELEERQLIALQQQMVRRGQRGAVCRECSASHDDDDDEEGEGSSDNDDGAVETPSEDQRDVEGKEKTDQSQQTTPTTPPADESNDDGQRYILETLTMTTVSERQVIKEAEEKPQSPPPAPSVPPGGSPISGILKGGRLWKQTSNETNTTNNNVKSQDIHQPENITSDDEGTNKRSVRFTETKENERDVCDGAPDMGSLQEEVTTHRKQEEMKGANPQGNESTEMMLTFKLGNHVLISNNSLKPNSAVRQLFPCTKPPGKVEEDSGNNQQYLVTAESLKAFEEAKRSKLPQIIQSGDTDESIRRAIERNTLRRSLIRGDPKNKKSTQKTDNSLVERIKQLTCDVDDDLNVTPQDLQQQRASPPGEEARNSPEVTVNKLNNHDKSFSPSSSSTASSNSSSMSSTYKKITDLFSKGRDKPPDIQNIDAKNHLTAPDLGNGPQEIVQEPSLKVSATTTESRKQFLSTLVPLTACVSGIGLNEDYYHINNGHHEVVGDRTSMASSVGTEYSLEDIDEVLRKDEEESKRIAPDVLAGTPSASESGDELAMFVQQDAGRIERIKKKYQPETTEEDDEHDDYGFNRRPSVRGIKPRFGSTTEILQQIQNQMQPPNNTPPRNQVVWPYYSETNLSSSSDMKRNIPPVNHPPYPINPYQQNPQYTRPSSYIEENMYQNCTNQRCTQVNYRNVVYPSVVTLPRRNSRPLSPPPQEVSKNYHQTMVYIPYNHIEGYNYYSGAKDCYTRVSNQNQINKRYIEAYRVEDHYSKPILRQQIYPRSESPQFSTARSTQTPSISNCYVYPNRYPRAMPQPPNGVIWGAQEGVYPKINRHSYPRYPPSDSLSLTDSDSQHSKNSMPNSPTKNPSRFIERGVPEGAASVSPQDGQTQNNSTMTSPTSPQNPPTGPKPMFYAMNV